MFISKNSHVDGKACVVENIDMEGISNNSFPSWMSTKHKHEHKASTIRLVVVINSMQKFSSSLVQRERGLTPNLSIEMEPVGLTSSKVKARMCIRVGVDCSNKRKKKYNPSDGSTLLKKKLVYSLDQLMHGGWLMKSLIHY